jgi:hypothetical protein
MSHFKVVTKVNKKTKWIIFLVLALCAIIQFFVLCSYATAEYGVILPTASYLGLDEKTVRQYYRELGGIRLGRRILFFEKEVIDAIQTRSKMGSPSEIQWKEEGKDLPEQEGGSSLGKRKPFKSRRDMAGEDKHGVIV